MKLALFYTQNRSESSSFFYTKTLSTHRLVILVDINDTKNVHSTLQQIDPARNLKKMERVGLHVMFYYYSACLHLGKTKENFSIVVCSNILRFINTGYFTSDNLSHGIKNATHITFRISEQSWLLKLKYPAFFGNG
jgi:hypothetical protein